MNSTTPDVIDDSVFVATVAGLLTCSMVVLLSILGILTTLLSIHRARRDGAGPRLDNGRKSA